jgi:alpha-beta hydrolase superfamily lysophospholipase/thiol-disulfide isomerase/thioredoxin
MISKNRTVDVRQRIVITALTLSCTISSSASNALAKTKKNAKSETTESKTSGKGSRKIIRAEAAEEKLNIGGDVPVIAWTDASIEPWAVVLCVHGLGLHKESFAPLGKRLAALGVPTYAIDVRGFGAWLKTTAQNRVDFAQTLKDTESSLKALRLVNPDLPIVLLGESMGGAIALQTTALHPELVDGLVSCVPSGDRFGQKITTAKVIFNLFRHPNKLMDVGKNLTNQATEDEQLKQNWSDDPKARLNLTPKELVKFQAFMNQNNSRAKKIENVPTLVVQGANDRLVKPASTIAIFDDIATPRKDLLLLGDSEHLIFENAQFSAHVVDVLTSWIDRNVGASSKSIDKEAKTPNVEDLVTKEELAEAKANENQRDALGHLYLGRGYLLRNDPLRAREEFKQVVLMAHGSNLAREADGLMLSLPEAIIAPHVGAETRATEEDLKLISLSGAMANDKASVLLFCAPWVEACLSLKQSVVEVMAPYLSHLNFVEINADQPSNQDLLTKFGIHPLPAVLFLNGHNEVVSYILGNDKSALRTGLAKIIDPAWNVEKIPGTVPATVPVPSGVSVTPKHAAKIR